MPPQSALSFSAVQLDALMIYCGDTPGFVDFTLQIAGKQERRSVHLDIAGRRENVEGAPRNALNFDNHQYIIVGFVPAMWWGDESHEGSTAREPFTLTL
jgi:hypothetical protein